MGDRRKQALRVQFDGKLKLEFHGTKITSNAGLLAFRELDEAFRLTEKGSTVLSDCRQGKNTQHTMLAMLRQGIYGRRPGYEDVNNAEHLRVDPAMRQVVGGGAQEEKASSTGELGKVCAAPCVAEVREALVVDHSARDSDQDRGEGCPPLQVRDIPDGRSRGAT